VAIARTLLKNPPMLIFDEATSALDSANERAIQAELRSVAQGKTTLVIAHRLSTVVDAHEIVVMEQGRVVERGRTPNCWRANGRYAEMWRLQQAGEADSPESVAI
jgi:ABC-type transport system involved in Fe-S cluster assembly fused permease/ATPase subunit